MRARRTSHLLLMAILLLPTPLLAQLRFQEGRHFTTVPTPAISGTVPAGKIEVAEVFSYLCSHCFEAFPMAEKLKEGLPADAAFAFVHAALGHKDWQMMQRAHLTAQLLGIADRNHVRMFQAIWETGEFPFFDMKTGRPRATAPVIRDAARFYAKGGGVTEDEFVKKAASPEVEAAIARTEKLILGWQVGGTPTFVVAGRYRVDSSSVATVGELQSLINFLVGQERSRRQASAAPAKK